MTRWMTLMFLTGLAAGCIIENKAHCHNQNGDATCRERGTGMFCSTCTAENDGCVMQAPEDESCLSSEGTAGTDAGTDTDPTSTGPGSSSSTGASTSSGSGSGSSSTSSTSSGSGSTGPGTTGGPECGNGELDPGENCDGTKFKGPDNCADATNNEKLGGEIACTRNCQVDVSGCCLSSGQSCTLGGCCDGLMCGVVSMACE